MDQDPSASYTHVTDAKTVVNFPFDLNNLFSMQYSFD